MHKHIRAGVHGNLHCVVVRVVCGSDGSSVSIHVRVGWVDRVCVCVCVHMQCVCGVGIVYCVFAHMFVYGASKQPRSTSIDMQ